LAREQEELAGIDDEFGALSTSERAPPPPPVSVSINGFKMEPPDDFENVLTETLTNGSHEPAIKLEEEMDVEEANHAAPTTLSALPLHQQSAMRRAATPTPPPNFREEPAKIQKWRELQKERLEKKDQHEENEKKKLREQAKRDLDEWYKNRNEHLEKTMKRNRALEQDQANERDSTQPGQEWDRVTRLCDFNSKSGRGTKDLSRLRGILLQMKNQPPKAAK